MTLDDRLRTVLGAAVHDDTAAEAQYRQLVDLLGSGRAFADGPLVASAYLRLSALSRRLTPSCRGAILSDPSLRLRSPAFVARLCEDAELAELALAAADLDDTGWRAVQATLSPDLQFRARTLRMQRRARAPGDASRHELIWSEAVDDAAICAPPCSAPPLATNDIAALARRIEEFRARHPSSSSLSGGGAADRPVHYPPEPANDTNPAVEICMTLDPETRISWSGSCTAMLRGMRLSAAPHAVALVDNAVETALRRRQPVRDARVVIAAAPAISGSWRLDAVPQFDRYGRFERHNARLARVVGKPADARGDVVRQALHELRTPLNALQGFAELIQQQLFGSVPHQYRAAAAAIAAESAAILAGLEEIERLVRLRNASGFLSAGEAMLAPLLSGLLEQFAPAMRARGAGFAAAIIDPHVVAAIAPLDAERCLWRLLAVIACAAGEGEQLAIELSARRQSASLAVALPMALVSCGDEQLFSAAAHSLHGGNMSLGLLGGGFALRLVAAEACAAGGQLERRGASLILRLPLASAVEEALATSG